MKPLVNCVNTSFNAYCHVHFAGYKLPEYTLCANQFSGLRLQNRRLSEPPSLVEYSNARVLKAPLQNLLAPCHWNTYHYQIKFLHL